jgi:hypothetical protein
MPIVTKLFYEPVVAKLTSTEDVVELLADAKRCVGELQHHFRDANLLEVLAVVEKGEYSIVTGTNTRNVVDFSSAAGMFREWRGLSEGGCPSCQHRELRRPTMDDTIVWCEKYETEKDVPDNWGQSPRVRQYNATGCDDIARVYERLDKILKGAM